MSEHTPEWEFVNGMANAPAALTFNGEDVLSTSSVEDCPWIEGDTDRVLRILNAHAGLVEACKAILAWDEECHTDRATGPQLHIYGEAIDKAKAALAAVGE